MKSKTVLGGVKLTDLETEDFLNIESLKQVLPSDNAMNIPINAEIVLFEFEEKMLKKIEETKKYSDEFKEILKEDLDCAYNEIIEELQEIFDYKFIELYSKIFLEYHVRDPITKVEKMTFQAIIDKIIKEYSNNYIEELSDLLVIKWLTIEERAYKEMKEEELAKSKACNKK